MTAREYLQELQLEHADPATAKNAYDQLIRQLYLSLMDKVGPEDRKSLEKNLQQRDASDAKYVDLLPTPFQSLQDFRRLIDAKRRIDATIRQVGEFKPLENLVLGSIETEKLNAMATFRRDSGEYLVVFNRGLLAALLVASNLVISSTEMKIAPRTAVDDIVATDLYVRAPKFALLLDCLSQGRLPRPDMTEALFPWPEKEIRWTKLEDAATEFAFAHEYAHLLLGHLSGAAEQEFSEDRGGWGREYEADSLALDFVAQTWLEEERTALGESDYNILLLGFLMQGVCLFFMLLLATERYSAEVRGSSAGVWSTFKSHPPTIIRWMRMLDKVRHKTSSDVFSKVIEPQVVTITQSLRLYYSFGVEVHSHLPRTPAGLEQAFQTKAFEALGMFHLVPPHLFIACRCARAALARGAPLDDAEVTTLATSADEELEAHGMRPLRDYRQPLVTVARGLSEEALYCARFIGADVVRKFTDRLADIFVLDQRTRY